MARRRRCMSVLMVAVAALLAASVAACGGGENQQGGRVTTSGAQKNGTGELRTDIDPLTKRFAVLGSTFQAQWMSGRYGDPDNPGPSTYWIDAVVTLDAAKVKELSARYAPFTPQEPPPVVEGLRAHLPDGPFEASDKLNEAFRQDRWTARAYLDQAANALVLVAQGT